jgi:hypothetical protein
MPLCARNTGGSLWLRKEHQAACSVSGNESLFLRSYVFVLISLPSVMEIGSDGRVRYIRQRLPLKLRLSTYAIPTGGLLNSHGCLTAFAFVFRDAFVR